MNDEQAEAQKARVQALYDRWVRPLGLSWWRWKLVWHRGAIQDHDSALFNVNVSFEYHRVTLDICLPLVDEQSDDDLEWAFVHECAHVFTIPLKHAAAERVDSDAMHMLEEHQASAIASALVWLRAHCEASTDSEASLDPA